MAITPEQQAAIDAAAQITSESASATSAPVSITTETQPSTGAPVVIAPESGADVVAPSSIAPESSGGIVAPVNVGAIPSSTASAPSSIAPLAPSALNRALTPLFKFNASMGLPDSVTYSRSSSASYIETYADRFGRYAKRLTNDYVGSVTNLLTYSEQFDNAAWTDVNTTTSKTGNSDLFKISSTINGGVAYITNSGFTVSNATNYTASFLVKAGTQGVQARLQFTGTNKVTYFDLDNGRIVSSQAERASITYEGNGTYRISVSILTTATGAIYLQIARNQATTNVVVGDHFFASEAQIQLSKVLLPYVKTLDSQVSKTFTAKPRYEEKGLLVEGASTNLLINSEGFDAWSLVRATLNKNAAIAPDGSFSAAEMIEQASDLTHAVERIYNTVSGTTYTFSIFVKSKARSGVSLRIGSTNFPAAASAVFDLNNKTVALDGGAISGNIEEITSGYFRVSITALANATGSERATVFLYNGTTTSYVGDGSSSFLLWGAQLEALPFATSYIRTEGSVVSRGTDNISSTIKPLPIEATYFTELSLIGGSEFLTNIRFGFEIRKDSQNRVLFIIAAEGVNALIEVNDILNGNLEGSGILIDGEIVQTALSVKNGIANYYTNGVISDNDPTVNLPDDATNLIIGNASTGTVALFGHIKRLEIYDLGLTANEVKAL